MSLPHYGDFGWDVEVLACEPDEESQNIEPELLTDLPADIPVSRVTPWSPAKTRRFGFGNLGWRSYRSLQRAGDELLESGRFDLVFFSTTQFVVMALGPRWLRKFGVRYAVDWQDPLVSNYYERPNAPPPPGGIKYAFARRFSFRLERHILKSAAGLMSVSPSYLDDLEQRYTWFGNVQTMVIPFGVSLRDIARATAKTTHEISPPKFADSAGVSIVYTGRLGGDMKTALHWLFENIARRRTQGLPVPLLKFYGTSYAPGTRAVCTTSELAHQTGIEDLVTEYPRRLPYYDALSKLASGDGVLLLGSTDERYSPSKIYPALTIGRPTLAIVPQHSVAHDVLTTFGPAVTVVSLPASENQLVEDPHNLDQFLHRLHGRVPVSEGRFNPVEHGLDSSSLTSRQCQLFADCIRS